MRHVHQTEGVIEVNEGTPTLKPASREMSLYEYAAIEKSLVISTPYTRTGLTSFP